MPIRFTCSHCNRSLTVRDELAGKRGRCPYCKQVVMVPASRAVAPVRDPKKPDVESLALAALGLTGAETVSAQETVTASPNRGKPIQVTCSWCDHVFEVEAELAGKQTPCPECRRIVRVQTAQEQSPRDWRQMARGPAAAAAAQPRLEGEWGTATARSYVSAEALEEAQVLPVEREPLTPGQWATRIGLGVLAVVGLYVGYRWLVSYRAESQKQSLYAEAEAGLREPQRTPEQSALIHLSLISYWQNVEPDNNRVRGVSRTARQQAAAVLQEIEKLLAQQDGWAFLAAQDLTCEYLVQCSLAGLLPDDIQQGVRQLRRFPNAEAIACQAVRRIVRAAKDPEQCTAALRRLCAQLAIAPPEVVVKPAVAKPENKPAAPTREVSPLLIVAAVECATCGATQVAQELHQQLVGKPQSDKPAAASHASHPRQLLLTHLIRGETSPSSAQSADTIEYLARKGKIQDAWQHYQKNIPDNAPATERWHILRTLAECALMHEDARESLEAIAGELTKLLPALPPRLTSEVQILRARLATAAGKNDVVEELLRQAGQDPIRRMILRAQAETVLSRAKGYLPPESVPFLSELPSSERACLLYRLAWHNVRADRHSTQHWQRSLSGPDRAIVAAAVLAYDSALPIR